jgi:hypothetical protein
MSVTHAATAGSARARWRRAAPHLAALALIEWTLSLLLGHHLTSALGDRLAAHPSGGDALSAEQGRLALELLATHTDALSSRGALLAVLIALYALAVVPLHGVLPALARGLPDNPWERSIRHTVPLLGLAMLSIAATVATGLALRPILERLAQNPPAGPQSRTIALALSLALLVGLGAIMLRTLLVLARGVVIDGRALPLALRDAWTEGSSRAITLTLSHLLLLATGAALSTVVVLTPSPLAVPVSLLVHAARVAAEFVWLTHTLKRLETSR